jgi:MFS family permease
VLGVVGFLVIDRLGVPLSQAQQSIGVVLMVGAAVTLLAQWWLIPMLGLGPRLLVLWGCVLAALGALVAAWAAGLYAITLGYAAISLGFGFFRPGFTSGASLAVEADEQNAVAGMVTSVNGIAYVAAPAGGVALYELWKPLPFLFAAALMLGLAAWLLRRLRA